MTRAPFFSVIIPTYNRLTLCLESLKSVLAQTYEDYEVLVVDDGSTDGTKEHFEQRDFEKVTYIYKKNGGVSSARNIGVRESRGSYICYLDSDDIWHTEKLKDTLDFIQRNSHADVFFHDFVKHDIKNPNPYTVSNSAIFPRIYDCMQQVVGTNDWTASRESMFKIVMGGYPFYPSAITVKRSVHDQYLWDAGVMKSEDFNLISKLSLNYSFAYLDEVLLTVKVHENNKSADKVTKDTVTINTMSAIKDLYCKGDLKKVASTFIAKRKYSSGLGQIKRGNYRLGVTWLISALLSRELYLSKVALTK